jgi:hypothetical protein
LVGGFARCRVPDSEICDFIAQIGDFGLDGRFLIKEVNPAFGCWIAVKVANIGPAQGCAFK